MQKIYNFQPKQASFVNAKTALLLVVLCLVVAVSSYLFTSSVQENRRQEERAVNGAALREFSANGSQNAQVPATFPSRGQHGHPAR